ncbi:MAG: cytochrome c [Phycisphaerales bacterium]|nr:cytochrome c [Phycisphaerales bacterium]
MFKPLFISIPIIFAIGCGEKEKVESAPSVSTGSTLWKSSCASCHGADGQGLPELSPNLIGSEFIAKSSDEELIEYITIGRKADDPNSVMNLEMPPKGGNPMLKENDILSIVAYIRTLQ